ncbi:uncharacterized protein LOC116950245 [Petromyzon marinus]|uniref:uncharacterized protein LOC116950245 n=1 Tax=Petromyzon marinus TaxID=7757 RepID=UPI003F6E6884
MPPWLCLAAAWALCTLGVETVQDRLMSQIEAKHYYNCEGAGPYVVHRSDCSQVPGVKKAPQTWSIYKDQQEVIASTTNSTCVKPCIAVFSNCTLILSRCPAVLLQVANTSSVYISDTAIVNPPEALVRPGKFITLKCFNTNGRIPSGWSWNGVAIGGSANVSSILVPIRSPADGGRFSCVFPEFESTPALILTEASGFEQVSTAFLVSALLVVAIVVIFIARRDVNSSSLL